MTEYTKFNPANRPLSSYTYDQTMLETQSINHQFLDYKDRVMKVYAKNIIAMLSVRRLHPDDYKQIINAYLKTDTSKYDGYSVEIPFVYTNDCVELYSEQEVNAFEQLNAKTIAEGNLIPWLPDVDYVYLGEERVDPNTGEKWTPNNFRLVERPKLFEHNLKVSQVKQ